MSTVTYPGVYIRELQSGFLTITSGASAVPVFPVEVTEDKFALTQSERVPDWLTFTRLVEAAQEATPFVFDGTNRLHITLKTYFDNGGGVCYLVPTGDTFVDNVKALDDVTLVVEAGVPAVKADVESLCMTGETRFAVLDGPKGAIFKRPPEQRGSDVGWGDTYPETAFAAAYYPWLTATWAVDADGKLIEIPPSAAIAGVICSVDRTQGPWKAPANVALAGGVVPLYKVSDDDQSQCMVPKALNMIRTFHGTGPLVWGARTLKSSDDDWRYVSVRRLFNAVQMDLKRALAYSVFEPNSQPTWEGVKSAISSYLNALWKRGGLQGSSEQEAFIVKVGKGITMTDDDIRAGKMIVEIGLAAVRPAEYIILQFTQDMLSA